MSCYYVDLENSQNLMQIAGAILNATNRSDILNNITDYLNKTLNFATL